MSGRVGSITTEIIADGLIFNMDAANRASYPKTGNIATDVISLNVSASFEQNTSFDSSNNGVFDFDGTDDYMTTNINANDYQTAFTVLFWVNFDGFGSGNIPIGRHYGNERFYFGTQDSTYMKAGIGDSYTFDSIAHGLSTGEWSNFCYTRSGTTNTLYINALQKGTFTSNWSGTNTTQVYIGALNNSGASQYLNGKLANIQMYNRALSANEVLHNYNALKGRFGL
tara:strand:- start:4479 stop:5156 length:678 start_codon:yes stop_codon:yes gene_type:complete